MARGSAIESVISLVILGVLGYVAWQVYQKQAASGGTKFVTAGAPDNLPFFANVGGQRVFVRPTVPTEDSHFPNEISFDVTPMGDPAFGSGSHGSGADSTGK